MRTIALMLAAVLLLSSIAVAQKPSGHIGANRAFDHRQGGETIDDAVEVSFPFSDSGATCDNIDNYDEECPYAGSTSPDVVYTFVPTYDTVADVDFLGSTYDTKAYIYDENLILVACNDDYYPDYVSLIEAVNFQAGMRYYLVVDGYGGDCGEYVVSVCDILPCATSCYGADVLENEPPLTVGYVDTYNGGCEADEPVFQFLELPPGEEVLHFCGDSGYAGQGSQTRIDTDWFQVVAMSTELEIEFHAPYGFPMALDVLFLDDCENVSLLPYEISSCGAMDGIIVPTHPGQLITLRAAPLHEIRPGCTWEDIDQYRIYIWGLSGSVATEHHSWSDIKALYE